MTRLQKVEVDPETPAKNIKTLAADHILLLQQITTTNAKQKENNDYIIIIILF